MGRKGLRIVAILLATVGAVLLLLWCFRGAILGATITSQVSALTGCPVTLAAARLSVSGQAELEGLELGNPPGFRGPSALRIEHLSLQVDVSTLTAGPVVIRKVLVDGIRVTYVRAGRGRAADKPRGGRGLGQTNIAEIERRLTKSLGGAVQRLVVDELAVTNAHSRLWRGRRAFIEVPLKDLSLEGIGRDQEGLPPAELVGQVFRLLHPSLGNAVRSVDFRAWLTRQSRNHKGSGSAGSY